MSETVQNKIRKKVPWVFAGIRLPLIKFPTFKDKNLDIPTPSRNIILGAIYIVLFWLIMGGVYLAIPNSNGQYQIALGADSSGNPIWIYPSINQAFIIESIVAGIVIFIGAFGFLILYQATKHMYNTSYAQKMIVLGLILSTISFVILQFIILKAKSG